MKPIVIFGVGKISYAVSTFIRQWGGYEIRGYVVDDDAVTSEEFLGKPVACISKAGSVFDADECQGFVAVGYQDLNRLRQNRCEAMESLGFELCSVVDPAVPVDIVNGKNCFLAGGQLYQPGVVCGDNVFIWNGAMIGHNCELLNNSWVTGGASLGGNVTLGANSFVGIGAVISHQVRIGELSLLGAGSLVTNDVPDKSVLIEKGTEIYRLNSEQFIRFSASLER